MQNSQEHIEMFHSKHNYSLDLVDTLDPKFCGLFIDELLKEHEDKNDTTPKMKTNRNTNNGFDWTNKNKVKECEEFFDKMFNKKSEGSNEITL